MASFSRNKIKRFIKKYEEQLKEIAWLEDKGEEGKKLYNKLKQNINSILGKLNELKELNKNTKVFQIDFKESEAASSALYQYFDDRLKELKAVNGSPARKIMGRTYSENTALGSIWTAGGSVLGCAVVGLLAALGVTPVGWIAIPAILLICSVAAIVYISVSNYKSIQQTTMSNMSNLGEEVNSFSEKISQLEKINTHIEEVTQVFKANVQTESISKASCSSLKFNTPLSSNSINQPQTSSLSENMNNKP